MLTAIKSFVESAFQGGAQDLETIEYESYKIILHNFHTFYIAVIASGALTADYKRDLSDLLMAFAEKHRVFTREELTEANVEKNSKAIKAHFNEFLVQNQ
ncbi:MAG: cell envelope biogenesis protein OmpA, partial [Bacteroidota bacterium]